MKILVIEDDPITVEALELFLQGYGYKTDHAENGHSGFVRLEVSTPDVIFLDYMMPGMDGLEFVRELRRDPRWQNLPVVLMTAAADDDCRRVVEEAGFHPPIRVLRKPLESVDLLEILREIGEGKTL